MTVRVPLTSMLIGGVLLIAPPLAWQHSLPDDSTGDPTIAAAMDPADATSPPDTTPDADPDTDEDASPQPEPAAPAPTPGIPTRLQAESIDLDAPLDAVGLEDDGAMELPDDVRRVGWYEPGVRPGAAGSAVLAGHVDSRAQGQGALFELRQLEPGDQVTTLDDDGWTWTWEVTARTTHARDELPIDDLFRWEGPEQLRIITCGGTFDAARGGYSHNVVIHAVPRGEPLAPGAPAVDESAGTSR